VKALLVPENNPFPKRQKGELSDELTQLKLVQASGRLPKIKRWFSS
jgi:hypothetical protein